MLPDVVADDGLVVMAEDGDPATRRELACARVLRCAVGQCAAGRHEKADRLLNTRHPRLRGARDMTQHNNWDSLDAPALGCLVVWCLVVDGASVGFWVRPAGCTMSLAITMTMSL